MYSVKTTYSTIDRERGSKRNVCHHNRPLCCFTVGLRTPVRTNSGIDSKYDENKLTLAAFN